MPMPLNILLKYKNKLEKRCPCIGLPNSPSQHFTPEELARERELAKKEALLAKKKLANKNTSGNNSQTTKNSAFATNVRTAKGGTINYQEYLALLDKLQLQKNAVANK